MNHYEERVEFAEQARDVRRELVALADITRAMFPVGTKVEYQHGERWIGPCTVTSVDKSCSDYFGPDIRLLNDKTGKQPPPMTASRVRRTGENWDGFRTGWLLEQEVGA